MTELWYRFNLFAEKKFFDKTLVDGLIVPAHLIAYYDLALPNFLEKKDIPFLIDPVTYIWDLDRRHITKKSGDLKKSYEKLVTKLECTVANMLGKNKISRIEPNSTEFKEFVNNILKFQLLDEWDRKPARQYSLERIKRFRRVSGLGERRQFKPYALIPPYFFFRNVSENAYSQTLYAAQLAKDLNRKGENKVFPCLCMDKTILTDERQLVIIQDNFKEYDGVILWVSDFNETEATLSELKGLVNFVSIMGRSAKVINFYGGFFSLLLHYVGLSVLSSGICYSRHKNVFSQAGGGGLPIRYYEPSLKRKLMGDDMFELYNDMPELFTCECPICTTFSQSYAQTHDKHDKEKILNDFFGIYRKNKLAVKGIIDWENSRRHFLHSRKIEKMSLDQKQLGDRVEDLKTKYKYLIDNHFDPFKFKSCEYLQRWAYSLSSSHTS